MHSVYLDRSNFSSEMKWSFLAIRHGSSDVMDPAI